MTVRIRAALPAVALASALTAVSLTLAACGGAQPASGGATPPSAATSPSGNATAQPTDVAAAYARTPAAQVQRDVEAALRGATSLHMAGSIVEGTDQIDFDVSVDTSGDCTGTMGLRGTTLRLLGTGGAYYFKAPRSFWQSQSPAHADQIWAAVGGRWVKMGSAAQGSQMSSLCNLTDFTDGLFKDGAADRHTRVVGPSQFQGQPTVQLAGHSSSGAATTVQVLAASPHYPVRVDAGRQGEMTFSRFDEPVEVSAPPAAEVVDLAQVG